jgi:hypothetical protein
MSLDGQLDVGVTPEAVEFVFSVTNAGDEPVTIRFRSGLAADIAVHGADAAVWQWSDSRLFTQARWSETLAPGESVTHEATWPDPEPGTYEVRYTTDQGDNPTLASETITVVSVEYAVEAPDTVAAGADFQVEWTGPNGESDYITIVPAGAEPGQYGSYAYTSSGNPVTITAPDEPGNYEVRYQADAVYASTPITVE